MRIVYSNETAPDSFTKSIFLAGPTPRKASVKSWRPDALKILTDKKYDGVVFVPEFRGGKKPDGWTYEEQCKWEHKCLDMADIILFWVPRNLRTMPAFTTNVEFGIYAHSGKIVLGSPKNAPKMSYFKFMSDKFAIPRFNSLESTLSHALEIIGEGAERAGGECTVPLKLWRTQSFRSWHAAKTKAGHKLLNARVDFLILKGKKRDWVYAWGMQADISVFGENRRKHNESVISRPDISTVLMFRKEENIMDSVIVLVREFRSSASTKDGFIWELPGGSSASKETPLESAFHEVFEETGLEMENNNLSFCGARQLAGTFSAHKAYLYAYPLNADEINWLKKQKNLPHGADFEGTGERTYVELKTLKEIMYNGLLDWSNIGMILSVLN